MGEIRTKVILSNAVDETLAALGRLNVDEVRRLEVDAIVDEQAIASTVPRQVAEHLGLAVRPRWSGDNVSDAILWNIFARDTIEQAFVIGVVPRVGSAVLAKLDLAIDHAGQCVTVNPNHPHQFIIPIR